MPNFEIPYDNLANYDFDSNKIEVDGGLAKLKESSLWNGLKVYLRMEEASWNGTPDEIQDSSGNGNHGKATGTTNTDARGKMGRCGVFNADGLVELPDLAFLDNAQKFTLAFWLDTNGSGRNMAFSKVIDNTHRVSVNVNYIEGGTYFVVRNGNSCYGKGNIPAAGWHFFVFVFDGTQAVNEERMKMYIDDAPQTLTFNEDVPASTGDLPAAQLGGYLGSDFMTAKMDEFAGWDRPLNVAEASELFNAGNGKIMEQYASDEPSIVKTGGFADAIYSWESFSESLGAGNEGSVGYQLSKNGTDWDYWDGNEWTVAGTNRNTAAEISANLASYLPLQDTIFVKAFLISDGTQAVELEENLIAYVQKLSYASEEVISGNGSDTEFELRQNFRNGTCKILYNGKVFYEYREVAPNKIKFDFAPSANDVIKISYYSESEGGKLNAVRYATPAQLKAFSRAENIGSEDEANLEQLIRESEAYIDDYCGFWEKYDEEQQYLFPRTEDEDLDENYPAVPRLITNATMLFAEKLFLDGNPQAGGSGSEIVEERIGDYSYKKSTVASGDVVPNKVKALLRGFRKLTGKINIKTE